MQRVRALRWRSGELEALLELPIKLLPVHSSTTDLARDRKSRRERIHAVVRFPSSGAWRPGTPNSLMEKPRRKIVVLLANQVAVVRELRV